MCDDNQDALTTCLYTAVLASLLSASACTMKGLHSWWQQHSCLLIETVPYSHPVCQAYLLRFSGTSNGAVESMSLNQCKNPARVSTKWQQPQLLLRAFQSSMGPCTEVPCTQETPQHM